MRSRRPPLPHCTTALPSFPMPEPDAFRDWANLPELPLEEVLQGLLPCVRSVSAFAATCRPWRRLLRASAAGLIRPRVPPLLLLLCPAPRLTPFSPLVAPQPIPCRLTVPAEGSTLLCASRGHLALLRRKRNSLHLVDALTGAERRAFRLPSPHFPYHYAALSPSRLLLFHSKHAFFSLPFPGPEHHPHPEWTKHALPRAASFVTTVLEFRGRVLGLTDRAQILEFLHLDGALPNQVAVHMLPTAGLPAATRFDRSHLGPHLVAAGERLLLVLFMKLGPNVRRVNKIAVYALDLARMAWEDVDDIGAYTLFVDCAGRSAVACVDVGGCGVEENRVYVALPNCRTWSRAVKPGWEAPPNEFISVEPMAHPQWPSAISVYPPLFF